MEIEEIREYVLSKKGVKEGFPFGGDTLVFMVGDKICMIADLDSWPFFINLKQDPEKSIELRLEYPQIYPAWHMNKKHWNSVACEGLKPAFIKEMIDDSYNLVFKSLPKKMQKEILKDQ